MNAVAVPLCERCDAVCCRLTVVLQPEDRVPSEVFQAEINRVRHLAQLIKMTVSGKVGEDS